MTARASTEESTESPTGTPAAASQRVYLGIMQDLENRRILPGQRLVETELALRFKVGRNAVREAMQSLAARGVVDLSRFRSASIRHFTLDETLEVLEIASAMTGLVARAAARNHDPARHHGLLEAALLKLSEAASDDAAGFNRGRRHFYRALLAIGDSRELQRIFPTIGMHIIFSQYQSPRLRHIRVADYRKIADHVLAGNPAGAEQAGRRHVEHVRAIIVELGAGS